MSRHWIGVLLELEVVGHFCFHGVLQWLTSFFLASLQFSNFLLLPRYLCIHSFHRALFFRRNVRPEWWIQILLLLHQSCLRIPALLVHRLVMRQFHTLSIVQKLFALWMPLRFDRVHHLGLILLVLLPLGKSFISLHFCVCSRVNFLLFFICSLLLELLFPLVHYLFPLDRSFHGLLHFEGIIDPFLALFFSLLKHVYPAKQCIIGFECLR